MQIVKVMGESPNYKDALQGVWGYDGKDFYFITITKGVAHLQSKIAEDMVDLSISLPSCYDFYAQVNRAVGCRFVKVEDSMLNVTLKAGEQLNTNFKLK